MSDLLAGIAGAFLKPRIVHSLPGRLRLHLPGVKKISENLTDTHLTQLKDISSQLLDNISGIESVTPSPDTGNVLIVYDSSRIAESQIVHFISAVYRFIIRNRSRIASIPREKSSEVIEAVKNHIIEHTLEEVLNGKEFDIPDAIWT